MTHEQRRALGIPDIGWTGPGQDGYRLYEILREKIDRRRGQNWVSSEASHAQWRLWVAIDELRKIDGGRKREIGLSPARLDRLREAVCDVVLADEFSEPEAGFRPAVKAVCVAHVACLAYWVRSLLFWGGLLLIIVSAIRGCQSLLH